MTQSLVLPIDVKLMNLTATALFFACGALLFAAGGWWALRHPAMAVGAIVVEGELVHHNAVTLRANVAHRLAGNFFTLDLAAARSVFESVPWVREAVVRREFPNRLRVVLQEHVAVALWGPESGNALINRQGQVFEANADDAIADALPRLQGPDGQSAAVLAMHRALAPLFAPLDLELQSLALSGRGGWRAEFDNGAALELGGGTPQELVTRTQRFVRSLTQVAARYGRRADMFEAADLRHHDGYALRLRGVTTVVADVPKPAKK